MSVNSALQRARATLAEQNVTTAYDQASHRASTKRSWTTSSTRCSARYVDAFERYDIDSLTTLLREDATQSHAAV